MTTKKRRPAKAKGSPVRVVLYTRVSTLEQADSGLGLAAQERALRSMAETRGWEVVEHLVDAGASGKTLGNRPGLAAALALVAAGDADMLAVAKLDRLSRSLCDFAGLMAQSQKQGWGLVALDVNVDTSTPSGMLVANVMASVAAWEADTIAARTRDALAMKRAAGVRLGRPRALPVEVVDRIARARAAGATMQSIADDLTRDGVPTARGGAAWSVSSVQRVLGYVTAPT